MSPRPGVWSCVGGGAFLCPLPGSFVPVLRCPSIGVCGGGGSLFLLLPPSRGTGGLEGTRVRTLGGSP